MKDKTPILANGVMTEGVFLESDGDRTTLIRNQSQMPSLDDLDTSITGGRFQLYCARDRADKGTLLGEFEIEGAPKPDAIIGRIRCTISGDKIFICARDLNGDPLKIRRVE